MLFRSPSRSYEVAGLSVTSIKQFHTGDSYGYRFSQGGKSIVYSTDCEHKSAQFDETYPFVEFYRNANLLIFDAMYSLGDSVSVKEDWGHSSNVVGVELCQMANVKHLCLFHHEPVFDDARIDSILQETVRFEEITRNGQKVRISSAYDGMVIEV